MFRKDVPPIIITAEEVGRGIAVADDLHQRNVLRALAREVSGWGRCASWPSQCRAIVDGFGKDSLSQDERTQIAAVLNVLLEHLEEPVRERNTNE